MAEDDKHENASTRLEKLLDREPHLIEDRRALHQTLHRFSRDVYNIERERDDVIRERTELQKEKNRMNITLSRLETTNSLHERDVSVLEVGAAANLVDEIKRRLNAASDRLKRALRERKLEITAPARDPRRQVRQDRVFAIAIEMLIKDRFDIEIDLLEKINQKPEEDQGS